MFMHGPITREQHDSIMRLSEIYVRSNGYCWLVYWVPDHGLHPQPCA